MLNNAEKLDIKMRLAWSTDKDLLLVIHWCIDHLEQRTQKTEEEKQRSNKNAKDDI